MGMLPKEWLSEAVLFTVWRHMGDLFALCESELLSVNPEQFMSVMSVHPRPWNLTQSYARKFIKLLNGIYVSELTDIIRHPFFFGEAMFGSDCFRKGEGLNEASSADNAQAPALSPRSIALTTTPTAASVVGPDGDDEPQQSLTSVSNMQYSVKGWWCWLQLSQLCNRRISGRSLAGLH